MNHILIGALMLIVGSLLTEGLQIPGYLGLGKTCDPAKQNRGNPEGEYFGKVCDASAECNPKTKICDCIESRNGFKSTFQNGECKLLPGSSCVIGVDQDYYRCVENAKCTKTREGEDVSRCAADAPCDTGDAHCLCEAGKTCLTKVVPAKPV